MGETEIARRNWEDLTFDCRVSIFCHLGLENLVFSVPFVCRAWHEAYLDPRCWQKLDFRNMEFGSKSYFARRFRGEYGVSKFSLSSFMKLCVRRSRGGAAELSIPRLLRTSIERDLVSASITCPRLRVLAVSKLHYKDQQELPKLMSKWKDLETLKITWNSHSFVEILEQIKLNCPNFKGLHICGLLTSVDAKDIVRCVPNLKTFVLRANISKTDLVEILDGCTELEAVDVSKCRGFDVDSEILKKTLRIKLFEYENYKSKQTHTGHCPEYNDNEHMNLNCIGL